MLAHKADGHNNQIPRLGFAQRLKSFFGVGLEPLNRAHPALVGKGVGIAGTEDRFQFLHDQARAGFDLLLIGIASFLHVALRNPMGTEEDMGFFRHVGRSNLIGNELGHGTHIPGMVVPAANAPERQFLKISIQLP